MNFFTMLFNDPIVYISIIGLGVVLGICGFYVYFFIKNIEQNN
ncbi:DUF3149 domain-containing protein [Thalassotalea sp. PP2-459]|nr:DUF3149 domain-containing protein [Thalassotalea sp. PP2-459]